MVGLQKTQRLAHDPPPLKWNDASKSDASFHFNYARKGSEKMAAVKAEETKEHRIRTEYNRIKKSYKLLSKEHVKV